ncbi:TetR/AcrR family transcriptional regulator [Pedobacter soli]|uniref:Transcriptional regulator, TetR family n=1 Tax=Pedobacter soli TaxID=390242 RepID=A0A1G6JLK2_9SPHI|nr:TetR/AcrR family transcriptional regulator [Pedobacter soli]SDC19548.1 transcriptional regulator, TetR family [Pedobacter soli]
MRLRDTEKVQLVKQKAIELIVKDGLEGFSMNKLAKACQISVATLYIYYKDRDDLIVKITIEELESMTQGIMKDFSPEMSFEQGLHKQWENRYAFAKNHPQMNLFFDQLRSSSYQSTLLSDSISAFKMTMGQFMTNAIERGEIEEMPLDVYWSIAFAPLYNLIRLDQEGKSLDGSPFKVTDAVFWKTFDLVVKALKK